MKISVCIASFNGGDFIVDQVNSILPQLGPDDEVIVSDDASSDHTESLIRALNDPRIKFLYHTNDISKYNISKVAKNFEFALKYSSGDIIFLSDQDDIWMPDKVSKTLYYLSSFDLVLSDCYLVDENQNIIAKSYFRLFNSRPGFLNNLYKNSYLGSCMAFKRSILAHCIPFPNGPIGHDIWIGLVAEIFNFKIIFADFTGILYRRHPNSVTSSGFKSKNTLIFRFYFRLCLIFNLTKKFLTKLALCK